MKCPCDGAALARVEILALELDKCHQCHGIWCDPGELERLRDAKVEGLEEALKRKYGEPASEAGAVKAYMSCPRCGEARLLRFHYTYTTPEPVAIDRCERCHGVWLDRGDLNTIIGEKKRIDQITNPAPLKSFLTALSKLSGREQSEHDNATSLGASPNGLSF